MAIAGLHNVSVLDSSFLRDSQSRVSRQWGNQERPSNQAFSVLQMWRELEGEQVVGHPQVAVGDRLRHWRNDGLNADLAGTYVSESQGSDNEDSLVDANEVQNGCRTRSRGQMDLQNEHEDSNSFSSELSTDFGEVERERVRQTFRDWMNSGIRDKASNVSHLNNCSRAQLLGENERERVRIIREWVQMTSQQRGRGTRGSIEEQATEIGSQIEQVREGLIVNHCEIGSRRAIRRLCGRQALLDLLRRAERERQRELESLLEHRPVSDFPHRNRIQSSLKGRFLRSESSIRDKRPTSMAASELGLLRQRHTVSNLRGGFLAGLENLVCGPAGSTHSDTTSKNDMNSYRNEQIQANCLWDSEQSGPGNGERDISALCTDVMEGSTSEDTNWQGSTAQVEEQQEQVLENEERDLQQSPNFEFTGRRAGMGEDVGGSWQGSNVDEWSQEISGNEVEEQGHHSEALKVFRERHKPSSDEESNAHGSSNHTDIYEGNLVETINWQNTSAQVDEWQESGIIYVESDSEQLDNDQFNEWRNGTGEGMDGNWGEITARQWYEEISENEDGEHSNLQESHEVWHENGLLEAMGNWLEGSSGREAAPVGGATAFYFPDDDSEYSMELRELLSRRSVSNLLQSGFRESLDQLIQSYVERQGRASSDWELDRTSSSLAFGEQDQEQQRDQSEDQSDTVERTPLVLPSAQDWEVINDLRIDMARLQQWMNNMQRMLQACMDMQLELQCSVRQEVSAGLNRSAGSTEGEGSSPMDGFEWDHVRKGICCLCCEGNIDSLLYRCGHMCTCSRCANKLVQGSGKCPMCRAPVVEVIRAYSSQ